jgi:hypothetical protein
LTDVPIPLPVNELTTLKTLSDSSGPLALLAARGVIPLDYIGIATALGIGDAAKVKDWFQYRPDVRSKLKAIQWMAREGAVDACEFSGNSYRESNMGDSAKLAAYRYRRLRARQANTVLVNGEMHADARAAVEAVLGPLDDFRPAQSAPRRRTRRQAPAMDALSQSLLDYPFGSENA